MHLSLTLRHWPVTLLLLLSGPVFGCGWWGDGESDSGDSVAVGADGRVVSSTDPDNDPETMVLYGNRFRAGDGVPRDYNIALRWYRLAAQRGYTGGQYSLGRMHEFGLGTPVDYAEAARWYHLAAAQNEVHSQHHLAELYRDGRGVTRDPAQSTYWLRRSAGQGHAELFAGLAQVYEAGFGTPVDPALAYQWWWHAVDAGVDGARQHLERLAASLNPADREAAEAAARERARVWALPKSWVVPDLPR